MMCGINRLKSKKLEENLNENKRRENNNLYLDRKSILLKI